MWSEMMDDIREGASKYEIWSRLGWIDIQRRYRRTAIGPFWTTLSVGIFIFVLGFLWARLWQTDADQYLPYLTGGFIAWLMLAGMITEGCTTFVSATALLLSVKLPLSLLSYAVVWRNIIVLFHNLVLFVVRRRTIVLSKGGAAVLVGTGRDAPAEHKRETGANCQCFD